MPSIEAESNILAMLFFSPTLSQHNYIHIHVFCLCNSFKTNIQINMVQNFSSQLTEDPNHLQFKDQYVKIVQENSRYVFIEIM
jgi:hypothetical protein